MCGGRLQSRPPPFRGRPEPHSDVREPDPYCMLMLDKVRVLAEEFDILHFHIDQYHFPLFREMAGRTVTTLHGRQELPDLKRSISALARMPLVSISNDLCFPNHIRA